MFVLGYVSSTLYNGDNSLFVNTTDFISKVLVYPLVLFILGMDIYEKNTKELLKLSLYSIIISVFINVFCFSIIYLIQGEKLLLFEYLLKTNIFTFISLTYLFMYFIKKYEIENQILWGIALLFSILNTLLTIKCNISDNVILGSLTSIIYSSSNYQSFSFLAWTLFPVTGYLFREIIENKKKVFYVFTSFVSLFVYIFLLYYSKYVISGGPLIDFDHPYTFYHMNIYGGLLNISLCIFIYSIVYLISEKIPNKIYRHIRRWGSNILIIFLVSTLLINYIFLLITGDLIRVNIIETIVLFIITFIISDAISYFINNKIIESKK